MADLDAYNVPQDEIGRRMAALGMLPSFTPAGTPEQVQTQYGAPAPQAQPGPDMSAWSWDAYKKARAFDGKDYEYRNSIWADYLGKVLPALAQHTGDDPATLQTFFQQQYANDKPVAPTRSALDAATDTGKTFAKGVLGAAKSLSDLYSPTSDASQYFGQGVRDIDRSYSPVIADEMQRRDRLIAEAQARGDSALGPTLQYMYRNPAQLAAEAAGMIAPMAVPGGVARAGAYLPMALDAATTYASVAPKVAAAANVALGGAMGGGQVRGNIYDRISAMPDADLQAQSPEYAQLRRTMDEATAKQAIGSNFARNAPEILASGALGAAGGVIGAEGALAGLPSRFGRAGTALAEAGSQAAQGAATQFATNYGLQRAMPQTDLANDVATSAVTGAIYGGLTGAAVGGHRPDAETTGQADDALHGPPPSLIGPPDPTVSPYFQGPPDLRNTPPEFTGPPAPPQYVGPPAPLVGPPDPGMGLPHPNFRAGDETQLVDTDPESVTASNDIAAVTADVPRTVSRNYIAQHLTADLRNGTLEQTAQQNNSLGRAAQALIQRMQERTARDTAPAALSAPDSVPALPSPEHVAPDAGYAVDESGVARPVTYGDAAQSRAALDRAKRLGLTSDVVRAQQARELSREPEPTPAEPAPGQEPASSVSDAATGPVAPPETATAEQAVLQNRDRSTAAAIQQMNAIAANPDPHRLGFSRDFTNGAPVVEANPSMQIPGDQLGREDVSVAADGRRIPVRYAVVDADSLLPSHVADGTPVAGYETGQPDRLRAIAGNGRVAGLQAAYDRGTTGAYRAGVAQDAHLTGINPDVVKRMKKPVLVRIMPRDQVTRDIGDVSNTSGTASLSAVEQARNDAARVNMDALDFDEHGEPTPESVRAFVRSMPVSEQVGLLNPDGSPTRQAVDRLMSATFARAYDDPELVRLYAQATDPEARTVLGGMASAAGAMSKLHGSNELDIRPIITEAAKAAVNARRKGVKLSDYAKQGDITLPPETQEVLNLFAENSRSAKRIGEALQRSAELAYSEASKPNEDMFGPVERAGRSQILEQLNDTARPQNLEFAAGRQPARQDAERPAVERPGPADNRPAQVDESDRPAGTDRERTAGRTEDLTAAEEPLLTRPTPAGLRAKEARQREAEKTDAQRKEDEARRIEADAARDNFGLVGSDRDADIAAAHGQGDLAAAEPETASPKRPSAPTGETKDETEPPLRVTPLTEKAIIVTGDTKTHADRIRAIKGAIYNRKHSGWIFSKKREAEVRDALDDLLGGTRDRDIAVHLESDRKSGPPENGVGEAHVSPDTGTRSDRTGSSVGEDVSGRNTEQGDRGIPAHPSTVERASGDQRVREAGERPEAQKDAAGPDGTERGGQPDDEGVQPERHERGDSVRSAEEGSRDLAERVAEQRNADRDIPVRLGDLNNIRETLPVLLKEQQEDVAKAEKRFHKDGQPGILFTNGTGTGKTYTGLGIAKRFARRGKTNILFLAPTDAKVKDWLEDGQNVNLDISQLKSTDDAGKGPVATTYANFGQNDALVHRNWDLIVADESHYLMSNQQGEYTEALHRFRELTNHPDALRTKAQSYFRKEQDAIRAEREQREAEWKARGKTDAEASRLAVEALEDRQGELNAKVESKYQQIRDEPMKNSVFLSATPFPYHRNLDYANGYLWPAWKHGSGSGPSERDRFYIDNLGYNWRYHRLESPSAEVNQDFMERELNRKLVESGAVSGRKLELDKDYSRDFVELESGVGRKIDAALNAIQDWRGPYDMLRQFVDKYFDYHARNRLLENLKARDAVERAKKHLALGRKVVVFHGYKTGHTNNPFIFPAARPDGVLTSHPDSQAEWTKQVADFKKQFPEVTRMDFNRLGNPIEAFQNAFGNRLALFNGDVPKAQRFRAIRDFNDDSGSKDVMLVQMKAGKEGISLHDTTGKKQRALMALPLPTSPTDAIQMEGRIYRTGNRSNAPLEYMKAGLDFEQSTFANTIAQRARTAENLALGHGARDLERAFKDGYINSSSFDPHLKQGTGGKQSDVQTEKLSPFDKAVTLYYAKMKERGKRDQRAGKDWFATPEPIGLKMTEWANLKSGEKALEPSAGDGAIARFFPENTTNTFVEPSNELQSRLALNARGDIKPGRFEDHHVTNKYDGVVMNPPFGVGGKTAIEHVEKAMTHLRDGGRIVALIPEGGMADKRLQQLMESDASKHVYQVADISLPTSAFERAGTAVKSHIVVLEKHTDPDRAAQLRQRHLDLSDVPDSKALFKRLQDYSLPDRIPLGDNTERKTDFSRVSADAGMSADDVKKAIGSDPVNQHVDIYPTLDEAPAHIRDQAAAEGSQGVEGFHDPRTGRVALIADRIGSPARAREVARHELIGHYGLENMVGRAAMRELERKIGIAEKLGNRTFAKLGADVDRAQPDLPADRRAREMIALMAERDMHNSFTRRIVDAVRSFLKRTGLVHHDMTDAEVTGLLRQTQSYLREHGRSLADPGGRMAAADFSRPAPAIRTVPGTSIPLAEKRRTLRERIQELRENPRATSRSVRTFATGGGEAAQPKWLENSVTNLFDYRNPLEQLVRRSGNTDAGRKFVNTMRTFEAKTQKDIHDFEHTHATPLLKALTKGWNGTFKSLPYYQGHGYQQFLEDLGSMGNYVKHGKERNAVIAGKTEGRDLAGSGRTNDEIDAIKRDLSRTAPGLEQFYEKLYRDHLKPMLDHRDKVLRNSGLLTPEMEKARPDYDWYLPLTGDPDETEDALSRTAAVSLKSPKAKQATGREGTLSQNALHNVLERTDVAIRRAGMQDFKRDFVNLMEKSPQAKELAHAQINDGHTNEIFEKYIGDDGMIHRRVKANASMSPDALVLHDGNDTKVVDIGNRKIFEALNGANKAQIDGVFGLPDKATRLLSGIYTRYNPTFPLMNKIRDAQSQLSLIMADAPVKDRVGAVRRAAANNATFLTQWKNRPDSVYHQWREKYEKLGGATMYSDLFRDNTMKNIQNEFAKMAGATRWHQAKAAGEKVQGFIDHVNEHMEMTSRVALFKALADSGMSEKDAALYVKNTMNFETKGKYGRQLGAMYTFAGPALFDARRMAQSLRTPRGAAVLAAQFAAMYGLYGAMKAMGGTDEDGVARLDKVPLSQTGRFLTMLDPDSPDGKGWKFPVGFGYARIALTLAAALHRYADGVDDGGTFASNIAKDGVLSNFSPIEPTDVDPTKDLSAWAMQQFAPSLMKPLLQLAMNQNAQGSPIHKPDEWTGNKLHFAEGFPGTSALFKGAAKELHDGTGVDVFPETLQHLLRSYGGNGVMEAVRAIQLMGEKSGTDLTLGDIPGAQTFASKVMNQDVTDFRQNYADAQKLGAERAYAQESGTLDRFDETNPNATRGLAIYDAANREIKALYKERKAAEGLEDAGQRQQAVRDLNRRLRAVQMMANKAYRETQSQ
ncbi:LPD38 domain-containing protein [Paraburkholderia domus]|uniref:Helicase ATP-binding domain-containing protein n=1 Tax=Paraburkholderia domus TaxID=2793075 RepID=A0A9N8NDA4_9BURK|nr:LPD38 domain-containing protein [Paraburkholderia domus]MBK5162754.1 DEAD/DEAH box helicase family protein [Burkholderia sp. R-70211]CAE6958543.1 hypothetical protein R70211_06763 [Paraburkholderia domus]